MKMTVVVVSLSFSAFLMASHFADVLWPMRVSRFLITDQLPNLIRSELASVFYTSHNLQTTTATTSQQIQQEQQQHQLH